MESRHLIPTPTKTRDISLLSPECSNSTLHLKRTLQKHIKILVNALPSIEAAEKEGEKHICALSNFLEQRECVDRVDSMTSEVIAKFPDLKSRLILKVSAEVEKEMESLTNSLNPLRGIKQAMQQARSDILSLASLPNAQEINNTALYEGSATIPSLALMMNSLETVEKEARELYYSRVFYLDNIWDERTVRSENIHGLWMDNATKVICAIQDCREIVKYFLEENL